jgi:threonine synthase
VTDTSKTSGPFPGADAGRKRSARLPGNPISMWDWSDFLPVEADRAVSLGEGMTPLLPARLDLGADVAWKVEARNPTGSQKDRAVSVAISHAAAIGAESVIVASTGSVGLSCAAYASRAGLRCVVLAPRGTPRERLTPMAYHGAEVIEVSGTFEEIEVVLEQLNPRTWYQASTVVRVNTVQAAGPKTIAFEIVHQASRIPDWVVVPIGGGGTIHGIWSGFVELLEIGKIDRLPRFLGVQAAAFDAVHRAFRTQCRSIGDLPSTRGLQDRYTVLRNLKHVIPPDGDLALEVVRKSGGTTVVVDDAVALEDQARLARTDGILCEPSSAVVVSAIEQLVAAGDIRAEHSVAAIVTGAGFREMSILPQKRFTEAKPDELSRLLERSL